MRTSIRLLLIEDSEDDAALVTLLLRQAGFEPPSERVDTARELTKALANRWDIVISDHSMPYFSGPDALEMVRAHDPEVLFYLCFRDHWRRFCRGRDADGRTRLGDEEQPQAAGPGRGAGVTGSNNQVGTQKTRSPHTTTGEI
jgi:CheY-like chemotaxis protein